MTRVFLSARPSAEEVNVDPTRFVGFRSALRRFACPEQEWLERMINGATNATAEERVPLIEAVQRLVRGGWDEVESSIVTYGAPIPVKGTRSTVRCHFLRSDASGVPRLKVLAQQLANQIVNYCIPRTEIQKVWQLSKDRQIPEITRMAKEAARLFTQTQVKTGEGAELLLYALLEKELQIPQILSKMSLKTSTMAPTESMRSSLITGI